MPASFLPAFLTICRGTWGQTGHSHTDSTCHPQRVAGLQGRCIVQVAAGGRHTLALSSNNELWAFGAAAAASTDAWLAGRRCLRGCLAAWWLGCLAAWLPGCLAAWLPGSTIR